MTLFGEDVEDSDAPEFVALDDHREVLTCEPLRAGAIDVQRLLRMLVAGARGSDLGFGREPGGLVRRGGARSFRSRRGHVALSPIQQRECDRCAGRNVVEHATNPH